MEPTSALFIAAVFALPAIPSKTKNYFQPTNVREANTRFIDSSNQFDVFESAATPPSTYIERIGAKLARAEPLKQITAELDEYAQLADDWDGDGALRPSPLSIASAKKLLEWLPAGVALPKPMISASGEIGLYWHSDNAFIDAVISEDGDFSLFGKFEGDAPEEQFLTDLTPGAESAPVLTEVLSKLRQS